MGNTEFPVFGPLTPPDEPVLIDWLRWQLISERLNQLLHDLWELKSLRWCLEHGLISDHPSPPPDAVELHKIKLEADAIHAVLERAPHGPPISQEEELQVLQTMRSLVRDHLLWLELELQWLEKRAGRE